jgi:hypothetical protein
MGQEKIDKFFSVVLGISLLGLGTSLFFDPILPNRLWGIAIDFSGYSKFVGLFFAMVGLLIIYTFFRKRQPE